MRILLTGASGFLGSYIQEESCLRSHEVMCLRHANFRHCEEKVKLFAPEILVHSAWGGVSAFDRNDAAIQQKNLEMSKYIVNCYPFRQIIALGSQDEYGIIDEIVDENHPLNPVSEYAKAKIALCDYIAEKCSKESVQWQWVRIFNMYGPRQTPNWLIPSIIRKCLNGEPAMDTTKGEQQYAYLYARDFASAIVSMYGVQGKSGIYNLSASSPLPLKQIFLLIKKLTSSDIEFKFGTIPYRPNQSMMICGNSKKFNNAFGVFERTTLTDGLKETINSIKRYE